MTAADVIESLRLALNAAGLNSATVQQRPRLLSDNGPSYMSAHLSAWLAEHWMIHTRGQRYHPMTQGKIERDHRSLKNRILLEHYYLPGHLTARLAGFVDFYSTRRYHESLGISPRPQDFFLGHDTSTGRTPFFSQSVRTTCGLSGDSGRGKEAQG
jgi:transposase InsO family protein